MIVEHITQDVIDIALVVVVGRKDEVALQQAGVHVQQDPAMQLHEIHQVAGDIEIREGARVGFFERIGSLITDGLLELGTPGHRVSGRLDDQSLGGSTVVESRRVTIAFFVFEDPAHPETGIVIILVVLAIE